MPAAGKGANKSRLSPAKTRKLRTARMPTAHAAKLPTIRKLQASGGCSLRHRCRTQSRAYSDALAAKAVAGCAGLAGAGATAA